MNRIQGTWVNTNRPCEEYNVVGQTVTRRDQSMPGQPGRRFSLHWSTEGKKLMWGDTGHLFLHVSAFPGQRSEVSWISSRTMTCEWLWQRPFGFEGVTHHAGGSPPSMPRLTPSPSDQWMPAHRFPESYPSSGASTPVGFGPAPERERAVVYGPVRRDSGREGRECRRGRVQPYSNTPQHRVCYSNSGSLSSTRRSDHQRMTDSRPRLRWSPSDRADRRQSTSGRHAGRLSGRHLAERPAYYFSRGQYGSPGERHACGLLRSQVLDLMHREITPDDYEILLQLDDTVEKPVANKDDVARLPAASPQDFLGKDCAVCLVSFRMDESGIALLPCGHCFHRSCITKWLSECNPNCPLCGQALAS